MKSSKLSRLTKLLLAVSAGCCAALPSARAVDYVWNVPLGYWDDPASWLGGVVPVDTGAWDVSTINNNGTAILTNTAATFEETQVGNSGIAGNLVITNGGSLTVNNWLVVGRTGNGGNTPMSRLTIAGTGILNKTGDGFIVGDGTFCVGEVIVKDSAQVNITGGWNGVGNGNGGIGYLTLQDNAVYTLANQDWNIGDYGTGRGFALIKDNATLNVSRFWIGKFDSSFGVVKQTGGAIAGNNNGANEWCIGGQDGPNIDSFGYYELSAGTFSNPNNLHIGRNGKGLIYQSGGSISAGGWTAIGRYATGIGVVWVSGGTFTHTGTGTQLIVGENGRGQFDLTGGTLDCNLRLRVTNPGGVGIVNLNGGTARLPGIHEENGVSYVNFNGATVLAKASNPEFMSGLTEAVVHSGSAIFDTAGNDITIEQALVAPGGGDGVQNIPITDGGAGYVAPPLVQIDPSPAGAGATAVAQIDPATGLLTNIVVTSSGYGYSGAPGVNLFGGGFTTPASLGTATVAPVGSGGLIKNGAGTLTLTGANTYTGPTAVNAGKLFVTANAIGGGAYAAADGAGVGVIVVAPGAQVNQSNLTLNNSSLDFDLGAFGNPTAAPINVVNTLGVNGVVTVNIATAVPQLGQFPLVDYSTRAGSGSFVIGTLPPGVTASIVTNLANSTIDLNITFVAAPRWEGNVSGVWDIGTTTNWIEISTTLPTVYNDGNSVVFNDLATGTTDVTLGTTVNPAKVTFNNAALNYSLSGAGRINGPIGLLKQGAGSLALNTFNTYSGPTRIEGGTLAVTNLANGGSPSPVGSSSSAATNLVLAGGTLQYSGPAASTDRGYHVAGGGGLDLQTDLTIAGRVSAAAVPGGFTKSGPGTLTYSAVTANNQLAASAGAGAYVIQNGAVVFTGAQTNRVNGETWIGQGSGGSGRIDLVKGAVLDTDTWTVIGRQGGSGTVNITNATLTHRVTWDLIVGADFGSVGVLNLAGNSVINNNAGWFLVGVGGASGTFNHYSGLYTNSEGNTRMYIGRDNSSVGAYHVSGNSVVSVGNDLHVGVQGAQGLLTLSNSATFTERDGWAFIGGNFDNPQTPNSVGTVTVADNASMTLPLRLYIGFNQGVGTLNIAGGNFTKFSGESVRMGEGGGVGTINHSAGTNTLTGGELWIGQGLNGSGTYNLSGSGVVNLNNNWLAVGREGAIGFLNISGGTFVKSGNGNISIAHGVGAQGTVTQTGGAFICNAGEAWIGEDNGPGIWTISGGSATLNFVQLARDGTATGTLNLEGGVFAANEVAGGGGGSQLNFNGGTLRARTSVVDFVHGVTTATVLAGGAVIDSGTNSVAMSQALLDGGTGGGLTKLGTGTLYLNGANAYTGTTLVSAGTLGGSGTIAGPVNVAAGASLAPGTSIGTLTINNTLGLAGTSTTVIEVDKSTATSDLVTGVTTLTYGGTLVLKNLGGMLQVGDTFNVFDATTFTGTFGSVVSQTPGQTVTWDVSQLAVDGTVKVATAVANPVTLSSTVSGGNLNLTWPQLGYRLEVQTNTLSVGLSDNWVTVPGSTEVTAISVPISTSTPTAFYRLVFP